MSTIVEKDLNYYKNNCEEDYIKTPISVLRYITELEKGNTELLEMNNELLEALRESNRELIDLYNTVEFQVNFRLSLIIALL